MIIHGNCLDILPTLPEKSVNLILSDLPYGTTRNDWDKPLPLDRLWAEWERILVPNGNVLLFGQGVFAAELILSNRRLFKYKLIWIKSKATNFLNAKRQPLRKHEEICVFQRRGAPYNPLMTEGAPYDKGVRKDARTGSYGSFQPVRNRSRGLRHPTDVVYFPTAESEGPVFHPTQKPVALAKYLVRTYSREGDLVLDPACGSGSLLLGARLEGRRHLGIELDEKFAETASRRLADADDRARLTS